MLKDITNNDIGYLHSRVRYLLGWKGLNNNKEMVYKASTSCEGYCLELLFSLLFFFHKSIFMSATSYKCIQIDCYESFHFHQNSIEAHAYRSERSKQLFFMKIYILHKNLQSVILNWRSALSSQTKRIIISQRNLFDVFILHSYSLFLFVLVN